MIKELDIKLLETSDYGLFKYADWNREINNTKVNQLVESMSEIGYAGAPIIVNESYIIIDGQHRAKACQKANIPVQFIVRYGTGSKECRRLNMTQSNWTTKTLVESFAKEHSGEKNNPYVRFNELLENYGEAVRTTCYAIKNVWINDIIRSGDFTMTDDEYVKAKETLDFLQETSPYRKYFNKDSWLYALISLYKYELIDGERMLKQLKDYGNTLSNITCIEEAVRGFNDLYNYQMHQKVRFVDKWLDINEDR